MNEEVGNEKTGEVNNIAVGKLLQTVSNLIDYGVTSFVTKMSELAGRPLSLDEALALVEQNSDLLSLELIDSVVDSIDNKKVRILISVALKLGGMLMRTYGLADTLLNSPETLLEYLKHVRPDLYEVLQKYPNTSRLICAWVIKKLF